MKTAVINIETVGEILTIKGRAMNIAGLSGNRYAHGFKAITNLLDVAGINYEIEWSKDVSKMAAITIEGLRFDF